MKKPRATGVRLSMQPSGFTLVVTISLLVLLTMIGIGILSLSSIQLRLSAKGDSMSRARSHARLAMMMALGDLQKSLGPDGRISVPAEQSGQSGEHASWVGVYDAWDQSVGVTKRPAPVFVQWLSSSPSRDARLQKSFVNGVAADEVEVVGVGTLGAANGKDIVKVPRVPITQAMSSGQVAWWIADESMKAHVTSGQPRNSLLNNAVELISANAGITANSAILEELGEIAVDAPQRSAYISHSQLALKNQQSNVLFHDVTTQSRGLPVDVTRKRFKYDFSLFSQLTRKQVEGLPLYRADGKLNVFSNSGGRVNNDSSFSAIGANPLAQFGNTTNQPGINMEELWIHANLYRNVRWSGQMPFLQMMTGAESPSAGDFRRRALSDPWYGYSKPVFASVQFVFSFVARPEVSPYATTRYRMLVQMDALVKVWNPNNTRVVVPAGASYAVQLLSVPFKVQWSIRNAAGLPVALPAQSGLGANTYAMNLGTWQSSSNKFGQDDFRWLRGNVGGLAQSGNSTGYTLEAGESKIFGYDRNLTMGPTGDPNVNLTPGWGPGRQALIAGDFGARNLNASDTIEFIVTPDKDCLPSNVRTYCNKWIGHRAAGSRATGGNGGLAIGTSTLPSSVNFATPDPQFFPTVSSSQRLSVSQYVTPKPFMIFGQYLNVEQSAPGTRDAFPSAPRLLMNSSIVQRSFRNFNADQLTVGQELWRSDPLPLAFDSPLIDINSQDQGRFGGGHSVSSGVTRTATRQLELTPPLSLMSLSHSIANGCADRFEQAAERSDVGLPHLQSDGLTGAYKFEKGDIAFSTVSYAAPQVERAIGNSFASPFIALDKVTDSGPYHTFSNAVVPVFDHSYLANAALFDSWFCSSIHNGALSPASAPFKDSRGTVAVLTDFFSKSMSEEKSRLFNNRIIPANSWEVAKTRLLNGSALHAEAISRMGAHVYLDGAFNVNSTRKQAWLAVLATARDTSKRSPNGTKYSQTGQTPVGSAGLVVEGPAKPLASPLESQQWSGFRSLTDEQLETLAEKVVEEVKTRGPFLSLADFLNRRPGDSSVAQALGAMQAAIEAAKLNEPMKAGNRSVVAANFAGLNGAAMASQSGGLSRSTGIPGYVMQSDVLAPFANELSVRGDTFRIRAYGAALDANQKVAAEAWCEVLVQRLPEYVSPVDAAEVPFSALTSPLNRTFGRRFKVTSFQWLPRDAV